jgi:hypothetical protein
MGLFVLLLLQIHLIVFNYHFKDWYKLFRASKKIINVYYLFIAYLLRDKIYLKINLILIMIFEFLFSF